MSKPKQITFEQFRQLIEDFKKAVENMNRSSNLPKDLIQSIDYIFVSETDIEVKVTYFDKRVQRLVVR